MNSPELTTKHLSKNKSPSSKKEFETTHFLVIINQHSIKRWDSSFPLPIGHPIQWVLEKKEKTFQLRNLSIGIGKVSNSSVIHLKNSEARQGKEIKTQEKILQIKIIPDLQATAVHALMDLNGDSLQLFKYSKHWISESRTFKKSIEIKTNKRTICKISNEGENVCLLPLVDGLKIGRKNHRETLSKKQKFSQEKNKLNDFQIEYQKETWTISPVASQNSSAILRQNEASLVTENEEKVFKKTLRSTLATLGIVSLTIAIWPQSKTKKEEKEIIPPQYTKIIMKQKKAPAVAAPSAGGSKKSTPEASKTQVVQAFRAKALQSTVKGLLKGGMTNLLKMSNATAGISKDHRNKLFDSKNQALKPLAQNVGNIGGKKVNVTALGGGKSALNAVGYGSGKRAGIQGQGQSYVALDVNSSQVEEGLTKDEVGRVIHAHLSEIRYCYESAMIRSPDVQGKLMVDFSIKGNGVVGRSAVQNSTLGDSRLDDCIIRRLTKWKFPKPKGGVTVAVSYPFIFKSIGR